jgi:hypothetical protein
MVSIQNKFRYHYIYFTRPDCVMGHIECLPDCSFWRAERIEMRAVYQSISFSYSKLKQFLRIQSGSMKQKSFTQRRHRVTQRKYTLYYIQIAN